MIDAGDEDPDRWVDYAADHGLTIRHVLLTHGHVDHVAGLAQLKKRLPDAQIHLHPADWLTLKSAPMQGLGFGFTVDSPPAADVEVNDGDVIHVGSLRLEALHTPGHAPGHTCFYEPTHALLFGGDLLFKNSIGRTDFPGCDHAAMQDSLRRVLELPPKSTVFPGHMQPTTLAEEAATNPFLRDLRPDMRL